MKTIIKITSTIGLTTILLFQASESLACSCFYHGEFARNSIFHEGVIRAKVVKYGQKYHDTIFKTMTVEITNVIKGDFNHSTLEFIGDLGGSCREYISSNKFGIGQEFLFVIGDREKVQELAGCGESSILVDDDTVKGYKLTSNGYESYSMSLDAMIKEMKIEAIKYEKLQQYVEEN
ncbi:MAG: hypothetical protein Tsb0014_34220 [Pleurocapsa sp.]